MKRLFNSSTTLAPWLLSAALAHASSADGSPGAVTSTQSTNTPLALDAAIQIALSESPRLGANQAIVDAATGRAWQLGRWSNPELELSIEEWPVSNGGSFSDSKQTIGVAQELPWPGKKRLDRQIGASGIRMSEAELSLRSTELIRDVKAAFFGVMAAERSLDAGAELLKVARSSADTARKRVDAGATSYQEQLRAEIQQEQAQADAADLQSEVVARRQMLATLLGRPDLADVALVGALEEKADQSLLDSLQQDWLAGHPSLAVAEANLNRAQLESRRARLNPYPDIKAAVAGGRIGETDQSIVEFGVSIPLPLLDTSKGLKAEAEANVAVAEAQLREVRFELERQAATTLKRYRTAVDQVTGYRERILPKSTEALRLVQTGFEEGKFNFIDLLDTQRTFAQTQLTYQDRLLDLNIAHAELEALLKPSSASSSQRDQ